VRLLIDTHLLIWAVSEPRKLPSRVRALLEDGANEILFSTCSAWELAVKASTGRPNFEGSPSEIVAGGFEAGFVELPIKMQAALKIAELPPHHRDPFDRLLVAQAMTETIQLLTVDRKLAVYSELVTVI
jgi:PIN domain nuclease of toxin-antitoxin system